MPIGWTEEDENRFRNRITEEHVRLVHRIMDETQKKYDTADANYQSTGSASTYRTMQKYDDLLNVCRYALAHLQHECPNCERRVRNGLEIIKELRARRDSGTEHISINEAIDLLGTIATY